MNVGRAVYGALYCFIHDLPFCCNGSEFSGNELLHVALKMLEIF